MCRGSAMCHNNKRMCVCSDDICMCLQRAERERVVLVTFHETECKYFANDCAMKSGRVVANNGRDGEHSMEYILVHFKYLGYLFLFLILMSNTKC